MADIRQSTGIFDDFNRDENPLSHSGDWAQIDTTRDPLQALLIAPGFGTARRTGSGSAYSYWTPLVMDGDDAECWSYTRGGNASANAWGWALLRGLGGTNAWDGYVARMEIGTGGGSCHMYRVLNGTSTNIQTNNANPPTGGGWLGLIRRNGALVEFWASDDGQTGANWTNYLSVSDSTYTTGLSGALHCFGDLTEHDYFGVGPHVVRRPQFFRLIRN